MSEPELPPEPPAPGPSAAATTTTVVKETSTVTTDDPSKLTPVDSAVFGVSVRAWITTLIAATVCYMSIIGKEVFEPLYGGFLFVIGFYFGQKNNKQ